MAWKRLFLLLGILCVMIAMSANSWVTQQETIVHEVMSWTPASDLPAPSPFQQAHSAVMQANLPVYRSTVQTMGIVGWAIIAGSLVLMIAAAVQPRRQRR